MSADISFLEEKNLFDRGLVIRKAWIRPPGVWEYSVSEIGSLHDIAIRATRRAAYNAGIRWLATHPKESEG